MKGVTRVTASLLAAAMTAGLGTTAVFATGGDDSAQTPTAKTTTGIADVATGDTSVPTKWVEVLDKDSNILMSTDPEDEELYSLKQKKNVAKDTANQENAATIYLPVGSSKTLSIKLDDKSTATSAFAYKDTDNNGKIDSDDKAANATDTSVTEAVGLENGTFTAKKAGTVTFYAYASDAVKHKDDKATEPAYLEGSGKFIEFNVVAYDVSEGSYSIKFDDHDTVYLDSAEKGAFTVDDAAAVAMGGELPDAVKDLSVKKLAYHGSQYIAHKSEGEEATFTTEFTDGTKRDDSDSGSTALKYATRPSARAYLSVTGTNTSGTVTVSGTEPRTGTGAVFAYIDKDNNGRFNGDDVVVSNYLVVAGNKGVEVYRVYNPNSGEHLYTTDEDEVYNLTGLGWNNEGIAWYAPKTSVTPVYRVYNPVAGEHVYTTDSNEVAKLVKAGWNDEGTKFYSASSKYYAVMRQYNPNQFACNHNYTTVDAERVFLTSLGWKDEGVKLYASQLSYSALKSALGYDD